MANSITNKLKSLFNRPLRPGGNVLEHTYTDTAKPVVDQETVKLEEPFGTKVPRKILERASGWSQLANVSHNFTIEKVQAAFRQAEFGDMRMLFGYYRDFFITNGMVVAELSKRKLSTLSEPYTILPEDRKNPDDIEAAEVIKEALDKCPYFLEGLVHLMNGIVFPVSVVEKTFEPIESNYGLNKHNLRYKIKKLYPVDYNLITYRLPYLPQGPINTSGNQPVIPTPPLTQDMTGRPEDTIYDPDSWEPDLRFWSVFNNGLINFSYSYMMAPDPDRQIVYRCNLLNGIARENWGGMGRSVLWWAIMSQLGADVFLRCLQKWGVPFIVAKVDTSQVDTVAKVMAAFENINIINALVINKDAVAELQEMNYSGAAEAHSKFIEICHDQISILISGQTLSSHAKNTGLGSGVADLQSDVRQDIIKYDRLCLNNVLKHQLFRQYLDINGVKGCTPNIIWGGGQTPTENVQMSTTILNLSNAGWKISEDSMEELGEQFGFKVEQQELPQMGIDGKPLNPEEKQTEKLDGEEKEQDKKETPSVEEKRVIEAKLGPEDKPENDH